MGSVARPPLAGIRKPPKETHTQMFPVIATCGHRCGLHITATTATPLAVLTGLAFNQPLNLSFQSSGTAARTSVSRGIADRLYFLAYFIRRALMLGGSDDLEDEEDSCSVMRSRTMAETQRGWSSD